MRPAQLTPENNATAIAKLRKRYGFNEAGAINAGKHAAHYTWRLGICLLQ